MAKSDTLPMPLPRLPRDAQRARRPAELRLPGEITRTGWSLPENLSFDDWLLCGRLLDEIEGSVQWWRGDWWAFSEGRTWGDGRAIAEQAGVNYWTITQYGSVARAFQFCSRLQNLTFSHHQEAMAAPAEERDFWLHQAIDNEWSRNQLRAAIKQGKAFQRTRAVELNAAALGRFVILYADPPWQYENPPMGGTNRSIENHYPTMTLEAICALQVPAIAHEDSLLFMWATSPKLYECMKVLDAWGFEYRTDMVWVKDQIGMGYHVRGQHESLLIAKRGELPPPAVENRPSSVIESPRLEHSAKPPITYDLIDRMYPGVRKIELFGRAPEPREHWTAWGNQA
jgi:N6-adenosine-specific RNA methylase IME4